MKKTTKILLAVIFLLEIILEIYSIQLFYAYEVLFKPVNILGLITLRHILIPSLIPYLFFLIFLKDLVQRSKKRGLLIALSVVLLIIANWNYLFCYILPNLFSSGIIHQGCEALVLAMQNVWNWLFSGPSYPVAKIGSMTEPVVVVISFIAAYCTAKAIGKDEL